MNEVDISAAVLAALEVIPADKADLTPYVRDGTVRRLLDASIESPESPFFEYVLSETDPRRVVHWRSLLQRDVLERGDYEPVLIGTAKYPERLARVWDAPPVLFVKGTMAAENLQSVAIVGSRETTPAVLDIARETASTLAANGVDIVSGLALGVDGSAHHGAIDANGRTTAVLGTGIQLVYPFQNTDLAHSVAQNGSLLSEFPPYAPRARSSFLRRNGTIAAMSDMLIVVDAGHRSGSRQAVQRAVDYGRRVAMWRPALGRDAWAIDLAQSNRAVYFSDPVDVLDLVQEMAE